MSDKQATAAAHAEHARASRIGALAVVGACIHVLRHGRRARAARPALDGPA